MSTSRIKPVENQEVDPVIQGYFKTAESRGAPNERFLRILARNPESVTVFYEAWDTVFYGGAIDHGLKEMMRVRMARLRNCGY